MQRTTDRRLRPSFRRSGFRAVSRPAALCAVLASLFAFRCGLPHDSNGGPGDSRDPGCPGTWGELERAEFVFEELSWQDLSSEGTTAFATGTTLGFRARAIDPDQPLPPVHVATEDPAILEAATDADADFPHLLSFRAPGTAAITLLDPGNALVDRLTLRVEDPSAITLYAGPLLAEPLYLDAFAEEPTRIVVSPEGGARLAFHLADGAGELMAGRWTPEITAGDGLVTLPEGRLSIGEDAWVPVQLVSVLGAGEGEGTLTVRGPTGVERSLVVSRDASPVLDALEILLPLSGEDGEEAGTERVASVIGRTAGGDPALGYAVHFLSSDPRVVSVVPRADAPDAATVRFLAPGEATLTAVLRHDSTLAQSLVVRVVPAP